MDTVSKIRAAADQEHQPLAPDQLATNEGPLIELDTRLNEIQAELESMTCARCPVFEECQGESKGKISRLMKKT